MRARRTWCRVSIMIRYSFFYLTYVHLIGSLSTYYYTNWKGIVSQYTGKVNCIRDVCGHDRKAEETYSEVKYLAIYKLFTAIEIIL